GGRARPGVPLAAVPLVGAHVDELLAVAQREPVRGGDDRRAAAALLGRRAKARLDDLAALDGDVAVELLLQGRARILRMGEHHPRLARRGKRSHAFKASSAVRKVPWTLDAQSATCRLNGCGARLRIPVARYHSRAAGRSP